jgi:prophage tail gpP-like protein
MEDPVPPRQHRYSKATATDPVVLRHRPTIIHAEADQRSGELLPRAQWEASVRAGRAHRITYTVDGWAHSAGLWEPNTIVHVKDTQLQIDDDALIVSCTYTRATGEGTHTQLDLCSPAAYAPQPLSVSVARAVANPFI